MSSAIHVDAPVAAAPPWWSRRRLILLITVFVVPAALSAGFNSYGPLTEESALRMAFATVAGQTISALGALTAVIVTLAQRRRGLVLVGMIALFVTIAAWSQIGTAGTLLLERLDLIADTRAL